MKSYLLTFLLLLSVAFSTPSVYWSPASVAVCQGAAVNLASYVRDANKAATRYTFYSADWTALRTITARKGVPQFGQNAFVNPSESTLYYAVGERAGLKDTSAAFTVQVNPVPTLSYEVSAPLCINQVVTVTFSSDLPGAGYIWGNDNTQTGLPGSGSGDIVFTPFAAGTSTIVAQAYVGNCASMPAYIPLQILDCAPLLRRRPPAAGLDFLPAAGELVVMNSTGNIVHRSDGARRHVDLSALPCGVYLYTDANGPGKLVRY
jgi:hypothetical protein